MGKFEILAQKQGFLWSCSESFKEANCLFKETDVSKNNHH